MSKIPPGLNMKLLKCVDDMSVAAKDVNHLEKYITKLFDLFVDVKM